MNKLLEQPPGIVETVVRYECPRCGNSCQCGIPYSAKTVRAVEYAQQNPTASVREIVEQTGVGHGTAQRAKARVPVVHLEADTVGRDGKSYPAAKQQERDPADIIKRIVRLFQQLGNDDRGVVLDAGSRSPQIDRGPPAQEQRRVWWH